MESRGHHARLRARNGGRRRSFVAGAASRRIGQGREDRGPARMGPRMGPSGTRAVHDRMRGGEIYEAAVVDAETQGFAAGSRGFGAEALRLGVGREDRALRERDAWRIRAPRRTDRGRTGCAALAPTRAQLASIHDRGWYERDPAQYSGRTATGPAQGLSTPNVRKFIRLPGLGGRGCDAGMDTTARSRTRESRGVGRHRCRRAATLATESSRNPLRVAAFAPSSAG